jgi:prefoldin subunit 5
LTHNKNVVLRVVVSNPLRAVDLGAQVYCQAEVPDTSHIFVDVGLGFHAELTLVRVVESFAAHLFRRV